MNSFTKTLCILILILINFSKLYSQSLSSLSIYTLPLANSKIYQAQYGNFIYGLKLVANNGPVTISSLLLKTGGSYSISDIESFELYQGYNSPSGKFQVNCMVTSPVSSGGNVNFSNFNFGSGITVFSNSPVFLYFAVKLKNDANIGNFIKINGLNNPVQVTLSSNSLLMNFQEDISGNATISESVIGQQTVAILSQNVYRGSRKNLICSYKFVAYEGGAKLSKVKLKFNNTINSSDVQSFKLYVGKNENFNSAYLVDQIGNYLPPSFDSLSFNIDFPAGLSSSDISLSNGSPFLYVFIVSDISNTASENGIISVNESTTSIFFNNSPEIVKTSNGDFGFHTIKAPSVTISTVSSPKTEIYGGDLGEIYSFKLKSGQGGINFKKITFRTSGNYTFDDLSAFHFQTSNQANFNSYTIYQNFDMTPAIGGGELYSINAENIIEIAEGEELFVRIMAQVSNNSVIGKSIKINGNANPVTIDFLNFPIVTNSQTDLSSLKYIRPSEVHITNLASPDKEAFVGQKNKSVIVFKLEGIKGTSILDQVVLKNEGNFNSSDISKWKIYFSSYPDVSDSYYPSYASETFVNTSDELIVFSNIGFELSAGETLYAKIDIDVSDSAIEGHYCKIIPNSSSSNFVFQNSPVVIQNFLDISGKTTIRKSEYKISVLPLSTNQIFIGSKNALVYGIEISKTKGVSKLDNLIFEIGGNYTASDIESFDLYANFYQPNFNQANKLTGKTSLSVGANEILTFTNVSGAFGSDTYLDKYYLYLTISLSTSVIQNNEIRINGIDNPTSWSFDKPTNVSFVNYNAEVVHVFKKSKVIQTNLTGVNKTFYTGSSKNHIYSLKIERPDGLVELQKVRFKTTGSYTNEDISSFELYYNTSNIIENAIKINTNSSISAGSGEIVSIDVLQDIYKSISPIQPIYLLIAASVKPKATVGHTIHVDTNPNSVVLNYNNSPLVETIQVPTPGINTIIVSQTTINNFPLPAKNIFQDSKHNIIYSFEVTKNDGLVELSKLLIQVSGNYTLNDVESFSLYRGDNPNNSVPTQYYSITSQGNGELVTFNFPEINYYFSEASSVRFHLAVNLKSNFTPGHTIFVNGASNPVTMVYFNQVNTTNLQTNISGVQTMAIGAVTYNTIPLAEGTVVKGLESVIYKFKITTGESPTEISKIILNLTGNYLFTDVQAFNVNYKKETDTYSSFFGSFSPNNNSYSAIFTSSGYYNPFLESNSEYIFTISAVIRSDAQAGNFLKIDGSTNNVMIFNKFLKSVTDLQQNVSGKQTILNVEVTASSMSLPNQDIFPNSIKNYVYGVKLETSKSYSILNSIEFDVKGNFNSQDISSFRLYTNLYSNLIDLSEVSFTTIRTSTATGEKIKFLLSASNSSILIGDNNPRVFYLGVNLSSDAIEGHSIFIEGASNPVSLTFTNNPIIINNQSNSSGILTIVKAIVSENSVSQPEQEAFTGSEKVVLYSMKIEAIKGDEVLKSLTFTTTGDFNATDIQEFRLYIGSTPNITSAGMTAYTNQSVLADFRTFKFANISGPSLRVGDQYYIFITVNIKTSATEGHNIAINGQTSPVQIEYSLNPNVQQNQFNSSGVVTIAKPIGNIRTIALPASQLYKASKMQHIYQFSIESIKGTLKVDKISFKTSGNYSSEDIESFQFRTSLTAYPSYYFDSYDKILPRGGNGDSLGFEFVNNMPYTTIFEGETTNFFIVVNLKKTAIVGHSIQINGLLNPIQIVCMNNGRFNNFQNNVCEPQTFIDAKVTHTVFNTSNQKVYIGDTKSPILGIKIEATNGTSKIETISFKTSGNYSSDDIEGFMIYYNDSNNPNEYYRTYGVGTTNISTGAGETILFSVVPDELIFDEYRRDITLFFMPIVKLGAQVGRTVGISMSPENILINYSNNPTITLVDLNNINLKLINKSKIKISNIPTISSTVERGANLILIAAYKLESLEGPSYFDDILVTAIGDATSLDLENYLLFSSRVPDFNQSSFSSMNWTNSIGNQESLSFNNLASAFENMAISEGNPVYLFIGTRVSTGATLGRKIKISDNSNLTMLNFTNNPDISYDFLYNFGEKTIGNVSSLDPPIIYSEKSVICPNQTNNTHLIAQGCYGSNIVEWYRNTETIPFISNINYLEVSPLSQTAYKAKCNNGVSQSVFSNFLTIQFPIINSPTSITQNPLGNVSAYTNITLTANGCGSNSILWDNSSSANPRTVVPSVSSEYSFKCHFLGCSSVDSARISITISPCPSSIHLQNGSDNILSGTITKKASSSVILPNKEANIKASNKISGSNTKVTYEAKAILLLPGFHVENNAVFKAIVGGCL